MPAGEALQAVAIPGLVQKAQMLGGADRLERIALEGGVPAPFEEHLGGFDGEGRVEEDVAARRVPVLHQLQQIDQQFLAAFQREGRDEQRPARGVGRLELLGQGRAAGDAAGCDALAISIGGFDDQMVHTLGALRVGDEVAAARTQVSRKQQALLGAGGADDDLDRGRA